MKTTADQLIDKWMKQGKPAKFSGERLSQWAIATRFPHGKGGDKAMTQGALGKALGLSDTAIRFWEKKSTHKDSERIGIREETLACLAKFTGRSLRDTIHWLGVVNVDEKALDLTERVEVLEKENSVIKAQLARLQLHAMAASYSSAMLEQLQDALLSSGIDVYEPDGFGALQSACAEVQNSRLVEMMITGDAPLFLEGWLAVAVVMAELTGDDWDFDRVKGLCGVGVLEVVA